MNKERHDLISRAADSASVPPKVEHLAIINHWLTTRNWSPATAAEMDEYGGGVTARLAVATVQAEAEAVAEDVVILAELAEGIEHIPDHVPAHVPAPHVPKRVTKRPK